MTALIAWPTSILRMKERSIIWWQHRLKREHPTGTERTKSLIEECGWKGGDSANSAERKNLVQQKNERIDLTPTGLLMEGDYTSVRSSFAFLRDDECNGDVTPTDARGTGALLPLFSTRSQNFRNNLLGWRRSAVANLRIFSSERLRSPRSTSAK